MTQYGFYLDTTRCTGCRTCEIACRDYKDVNPDIAYRKVYDYEGGAWSAAEDGTYTSTAFVYHLSMSCNHCERPTCVSVCPTGAMHKDAASGLVSVDEGICIGCGYCHMACPYNAPKVDREKGHSVKCNGCSERVEQGKAPICVEACPLRALEFGSVEDMAKRGKVAAIAPLPEPTYTDPHFFVRQAPDVRPAGTFDGMVANVTEVM
ncbi:dimethylsulfoxide reductase subunit B [Eggerthellaceae bacterium zg-1084]|uniref:Dimethylsulfoxide reductase subunit B n=1 Tax=Berryella wangjianweii TaxID=2734634 RepID=A0A6M8J3Y3_9ACTN|nr:DMSO/selenate family reductase complex B subunit [Berryella wangjianweii]NPD30657.1 dimethylsulfoxide reductase subunit B [Berryella wangjianweii]NPD32125.1 dimethylsulfoxide reductase subunit B [Eggerthellaceae bacterium zg-997]QKF07303.1 dimethylsulfoxide reductase subunit B [Berryella wangjianweii]